VKVEVMTMTLRQHRLAKDLKQIEVAKAIGVPLSTYNAIETGKRLPSLKAALKLSKLYGVPVEQINFFAGKFHEVRNDKSA
jgi:DNA-binding XRE family transcriptional regulator